ALLGLGGGGYWLHGRRHGLRAIGVVDTRREPRQTDTERVAFEASGMMVIPRAAYELSGRVVDHRDNHDPFAAFIPFDACVVWGDFDGKLRDVSFESHGRVCYFTYPAGADASYVMTHVSNNHLVPANQNVRRA